VSGHRRCDFAMSSSQAAHDSWGNTRNFNAVIGCVFLGHMSTVLRQLSSCYSSALRRTVKWVWLCSYCRRSKTVRFVQSALRITDTFFMTASVHVTVKINWTGGTFVTSFHFVLKGGNTSTFFCNVICNAVILWFGIYEVQVCKTSRILRNRT